MGCSRKRQMKRGSELLGCAFLWLAWLRSAKKNVLLAVHFIIPEPYGLARARGVVGYACVCARAHFCVSGRVRRCDYAYITAFMTYCTHLCVFYATTTQGAALPENSFQWNVKSFW